TATRYPGPRKANSLRQNDPLRAVRTEPNMSESEGSPRSPRQPRMRTEATAGAESGRKSADLASMETPWPRSNSNATHSHMHVAIGPASGNSRVPTATDKEKLTKIAP